MGKREKENWEVDWEERREMAIERVRSSWGERVAERKRVKGERSRGERERESGKKTIKAYFPVFYIFLLVDLSIHPSY